MIFQKTIALPLIALSMVVSTGCSAKPSPDNQLYVKPISKSNHLHSKKSKTSAPQYLKPGAAINYSHNLPGEVDLGQSVTFQLTLDESYDAGNMRVDIGSEGGVSVFPSSTQGNFDMSAGSRHVMDVSITVQSAGRHYLNVNAVADDGNGQSMPRVFSIPVQCGPIKAMKPHEKMTTTPTGENIIVMDAQETIQ